MDKREPGEPHKSKGVAMDRRTFLKAVTATTAASLAIPAISQGAAARTLRFVPRQDLSNFDPIWTTAYVVRNAGALVYDMLYGIDDQLRLQRQMVEAEEVSSDGSPGPSVCGRASNSMTASLCSRATRSPASDAGRR